MSKFLPAALGAVAADILSLYQVPGSNTVGAVIQVALQELFARRLRVAREIMIDELRRGDKVLRQIGEVEEAAAIFYRYARAAQEGSARLNLRLLAKVVAGQTVQGNLVADEFLCWADILASLRREEIVLLATLHRHHSSPEVMAEDEGSRDGKAEKLAKNELTPRLFQTDDDFMAALNAVTRTGLVIAYSGYDDQIYGISPLLRRLIALAPFEAALKDEP